MSNSACCDRRVGVGGCCYSRVYGLKGIRHVCLRFMSGCIQCMGNDASTRCIPIVPETSSKIAATRCHRCEQKSSHLRLVLRLFACLIRAAARSTHIRGACWMIEKREFLEKQSTFILLHRG